MTSSPEYARAMPQIDLYDNRATGGNRALMDGVHRERRASRPVAAGGGGSHPQPDRADEDECDADQLDRPQLLAEREHADQRRRDDADTGPDRVSDAHRDRLQRRRQRPE